MIQGQFRFTNDTLINVNNKSNEMNHIMQHEHTHKILSSSTTYGLLIIMLKKVSLVDEKYDWLYEELVQLFSRMQEQTATFIEYFWILANEGTETFNNKILELMHTNKTYYKYFNFVYQNIDKENLTKDYAIETIDTIRSIAISCLNINLNEIPFNSWSNKKDMQRFFSNKDNNLKYNPNKRFETVIKCLKDPTPTRFSELLLVLANINSKEGEEILRTCISVINKLYSDSPRYSSIIKRVSSFKTESLELENERPLSSLSAFPSFETSLEKYRVEYVNLESLVNHLNNHSRSFLSFKHLLGGLEFFTLLSCVNLDSNVDLYSRYRIIDIFSIIESVTNPIVLSQGKLYSKLKQSLTEVLGHRRIYLFMENSLISSVNVIEGEFKKSKYTIIPQDKFDIVVVFNGSHVLLQLVLKGTHQEVRDYLYSIDIYPANFLDTVTLHYREITEISLAMYNRINWYIINKNG